MRNIRKRIMMVKGFAPEELMSIDRAFYLQCVAIIRDHNADEFQKAKVYAEYIWEMKDSIYKDNDIIFVDFNPYLPMCINAMEIGSSEFSEGMHDYFIHVVFNEEDVVDSLSLARVKEEFKTNTPRSTDTDAITTVCSRYIVEQFPSKLCFASADYVDFIKCPIKEFVDSFCRPERAFALIVSKYDGGNLRDMDSKFTRYTLELAAKYHTPMSKNQFMQMIYDGLDKLDDMKNNNNIVDFVDVVKEKESEEDE